VERTVQAAGLPTGKKVKDSDKQIKKEFSHYRAEYKYGWPYFVMQNSDSKENNHNRNNQVSF